MQLPVLPAVCFFRGHLWVLQVYAGVLHISAKEILHPSRQDSFFDALCSNKARELVRSRTSATKSAEIKTLRKAADISETSSLSSSLHGSPGGSSGMSDSVSSPGSLVSLPLSQSTPLPSVSGFLKPRQMDRSLHSDRSIDQSGAAVPYADHVTSANRTYVVLRQMSSDGQDGGQGRDGTFSRTN